MSHRGSLVGILGGATLAAAFLGPGTITTAARAGSELRFTLLWTLVFATLACWILQEASARLTILTGQSLGEALRLRFPTGFAAMATIWLVAGAILLGCAAYEAGNILGGVAGARLALPLSQPLLTLLSAGAAGLLLGLGTTRQVVVVLSFLVALMGASFLFTAARLAPVVSELARGLLIPSIPEGQALLALGLVGTTVVPYNLFLGSGLARGQDLAATRFGLATSLGLGGLISMGVVVVGAALEGDFSYQALGAVLAGELGDWAESFFALGLFAAGFSSAVTAPLAAAMTARSLFASGGDDPRWTDTSLRYRGVWLGVLLVGALFGLTGVRPVPVILVAQAFNGVLLPVVAMFLFAVMNDRQRLGTASNGPLQNLAMGAVVMMTIALGVRGVLGAARGATQWQALASEQLLWGISGGLAVLFPFFFWRAHHQGRTLQKD